MKLWPSRTVPSPIGSLAELLRFGNSKLGRALTTLAILVALTCGTWIRPPISRDFRAWHVPWALLSTQAMDATMATAVPRPILWNSVGITLFMALVASTVVCIWRIQAAPVVFGVLFALGAAAVAVTQLNHVSLMESLDAETLQRGTLRFMLSKESQDFLSGKTTSRVYASPRDREEVVPVGMRSAPIPATWQYAMFGPWFVGISLLALLASTRGAWAYRLGVAGVWIAVAMLLIFVACSRRLAAEFHLGSAAAQEHRNEFATARQHLHLASEWLPDLNRTRRQLLFEGRLDTRLGLGTSAAQTFRAHQLLLHGVQAAAREELEPMANGSERDDRVRDLLAEVVGLEAQAAMTRLDYSAAEQNWRRAMQLAPWRAVCWIGADVCAVRSDPQRAAQVETNVLAQLPQLGDRLLRSDILGVIGDAYFEAGDFHNARKMFDLSLSHFNLPKWINIHAQEGLLGM